MDLHNPFLNDAIEIDHAAEHHHAEQKPCSAKCGALQVGNDEQGHATHEDEPPDFQGSFHLGFGYCELNRYLEY